MRPEMELVGALVVAHFAHVGHDLVLVVFRRHVKLHLHLQGGAIAANVAKVRLDFVMDNHDVLFEVILVAVLLATLRTRDGGPFLFNFG